MKNLKDIDKRDLLGLILLDPEKNRCYVKAFSCYSVMVEGKESIRPIKFKVSYLDKLEFPIIGWYHEFFTWPVFDHLFDESKQFIN